MSLKPPKKSDLNKQWNKPRSDSRRKILPEYHLIVTEVTKTEPYYFNTIKKIINSKYKGRIKLEVQGEGKNTISLFESAKSLVEKNLTVYKHVWIVYDLDDFPAENFDRTADLCEEYNSKQKETEYHALWSNQCIELWFLLHFSFLQSDLHRNEYYPKLSECFNKLNIGNYEKNRNDIFEVLRPYMNKAIINARKLDEINKDKLPSQSAPGTKIYRIIEKLIPYL